MIFNICGHVSYEYKITRRSRANPSFPNIDKHSAGGIVRMDLKMTNVLFSVETNVLHFKGITLTNKALFSCDTCINGNSLPFVTICFGAHSALSRIEHCSIGI